MCIIVTILSISGYKVPTKYAPLLSLKMISMFDASMKMMLPSIGKEMKFSNAKVVTSVQFFDYLYFLDS